MSWVQAVRKGFIVRCRTSWLWFVMVWIRVIFVVSARWLFGIPVQIAWHLVGEDRNSSWGIEADVQLLRVVALSRCEDVFWRGSLALTVVEGRSKILVSFKIPSEMSGYFNFRWESI